MKRLNGKVTPMGRLITRAEFEKRLGDFAQQMVKAFKRYEEHWTARLQAIEARLPKSAEPEGLVGLVDAMTTLPEPDITTERVEP